MNIILTYDENRDITKGFVLKYNTVLQNKERNFESSVRFSESGKCKKRKRFLGVNISYLIKFIVSLALTLLEIGFRIEGKSPGKC